MNRSGLVRLCSFALALSLIFAGSTLYYAARNTQYERYTGSQYERVFSQLLNSVNQLDTSLEKAQFLPAGALRQTMAADIWKESQLASAALSSLPLGDRRLDQVESYLSQMGDYAYYLMRNTAYGKETPDEWETLFALRGNAEDILTELDTLKQQLDTGSISLNANLHVSQSDNAFQTQLHQVNDEFPEYPSLIYDGPYSDHVSQRSAKALEGLPMLTQEQAREKAANLLNLQPQQLQTDYESDGQIPCYGFMHDTVAVAITKQGGFLLSYSDGRAIGEATLSTQQAVEKAHAYLKSLDLPEMRASYHTVFENILTINFNSFEHGILAYPDLIKVGVALDDGSVVRLDASGFVMNHHPRDVVRPAIDAAEARKNVLETLDIQQEMLCYIPTTGYHEVLCWEFSCVSADSRQVLQYINCDTGQTENLLLLIENQNGTMTR